MAQATGGERLPCHEPPAAAARRGRPWPAHGPDHLLSRVRRGVLTGPNGDDQYLARVRQFGGTTDAAALIRALASYGITAHISKQASFTTLEQQIAAGIPVPCGFLHRGPLSRSRRWRALADHRRHHAHPSDRARPAGGGEPGERHHPRQDGPLLPVQPVELVLRGPAATAGAGWRREMAAAGRCWRKLDQLAGHRSRSVTAWAIRRIQRMDPCLRVIGPTTGRSA